LAGDFVWDGGSGDTLRNMEAVCACELAAYFRTPEGGAAANLEMIKADVEEMNARDRAYISGQSLAG
jgi:hypothetical protein